MTDPPRGQSQMVRLSRWQFTVKKSVKMQTLRAISTSTTLDFYTPLLPHLLPLTPVTSTNLNPVTCTEAQAILHPIRRKEVEGCNEIFFWKAKLKLLYVENIRKSSTFKDTAIEHEKLQKIPPFFKKSLILSLRKKFPTLSMVWLGLGLGLGKL